MNYPSDLTEFAGVRVAVLGAAGFIARWVAQALSARGARLFLVVRDRRTAERTLVTYDVRGEIVELDLGDFDQVRRALRALAPTLTFNLAGYGVDHTEQDERQAFRINAELVGVVCEVLAETADPGWRGQHLVHVGSALEYGTIGGDLHEDRHPNPTTLYGQSKLSGTTQLAAWCRRTGLKGVCARLFTVYGPGEYPDRLLPSLLRAATTGEILPMSSGQQRRDFTFVGDVAEGLLRLGIAAPESGTIVNLATGRLTSVRSFVEAAARVLGIRPEQLLFGAIPTRFEEMQHDEVRLERLRALTGWAPSTSILDGISQTRQFESRITGRQPLEHGSAPALGAVHGQQEIR